MRNCEVGRRGDMQDISQSRVEIAPYRRPVLRQTMGEGIPRAGLMIFDTCHVRAETLGKIARALFPSAGCQV